MRSSLVRQRQIRLGHSLHWQQFGAVQITLEAR